MTVHKGVPGEHYLCRLWRFPLPHPHRCNFHDFYYRLVAGTTLTAINYLRSCLPVFSKEWPKGPGLVLGINLCHNHSSQVNIAFTLLWGKNIRGNLSLRLGIVKLSIEQGRLMGHDGKGYALILTSWLLMSYLLMSWLGIFCDWHFGNLIKYWFKYMLKIEGF